LSSQEKKTKNRASIIYSNESKMAPFYTKMTTLLKNKKKMMKEKSNMNNNDN
jgi:hypothetical protein